MIPTEEQAKQLWEKYHLPKEKRIHVALVARVADFFAKKCQANVPLVHAAALLHDIDKKAVWLPGEQHPDAGVRILQEEEMDEVARLVKTHPLHAILDSSLAPDTTEEKILFLADKMVKYEIIGVDKRFALWNDEHLPPQAQDILDRSYPKVKALEKELFDLANSDFAAVVKLA